MKNFVFMLVGAMFMAFGLDFFLVPNKIAAGGVSGIATIFEFAFNINASYWVLLLNIPILFIASFKLGKRYVIRSLVGTVALSVMMRLFEEFPPFTTDLLSSALLGGALLGVGMGIIMRFGYTTGGTDVVAGIMNKKNPHRTLGNLILLVDACIIAASGVFFNSLEIAVYAVVAIFISTKIIDNIVEGLDFAKELIIISEKSEEIAKEIMEKVDRGVTGFEIKGMYTNSKNLMLMCVIKKNEVLKVEKLVKEIDKNSFVILSDVKKVYGEGFDRLKI